MMPIRLPVMKHIPLISDLNDTAMIVANVVIGFLIRTVTVQVKIAIAYDRSSEFKPASRAFACGIA
ncbi:hypothetical protein D3C77_435600 [compost metagenome]